MIDPREIVSDDRLTALAVAFAEYVNYRAIAYKYGGTFPVCFYCASQEHGETACPNEQARTEYWAGGIQDFPVASAVGTLLRSRTVIDKYIAERQARIMRDALRRIVQSADDAKAGIRVAGFIALEALAEADKA